jgi:NAD-dependent deacetylase
MNNPMLESALKFHDLIEKHQKILCLTGAGISTESGIRDYRSQGGLWKEYHPVTLQEFLDSEEMRIEYWRRKKETFPSMQSAQPNQGHLAIAELEARGKLLGLITQNIDGLHTKAGSSKIIEIHGTNMETICLSCQIVEPSEKTLIRLETEPAPRCLKCEGLLKPNTISFGQNLRAEDLQQSFQWAKQCDLMLCIGSSLVVEPAASIPVRAKQCGAKLVILNAESTPLDSFADWVIHAQIGSFFESLKHI